DAFTGMIDEGKLWAIFRDHKKKISNMAWASEEAKSYLDAEEEMYLKIDEQTFASRNNALYVNFEGNQVQHPEDVIGPQQANSIIHTAKVALYRIMEVTEFWTHQIGSKDFGQ